MREISIRELRATLCTQLKDLPFELTKNGKVIGIMCTQFDYSDQQLNESVHNQDKQPKQQTANIVEKKQKVITKKSNIPTGEIPILGHSKSMQIRKKGK